MLLTVLCLFLLIVSSKLSNSFSSPSLTYPPIIFSEICSILKQGGVSLPVVEITRTSHIALQRIEVLHQKLTLCLAELETEVLREKQIRLEKTKLYLEQSRLLKESESGDTMEVDLKAVEEQTGIDKNDPILQWSNLHYSVPIKN
jgi:hypothetical protein